VAILSQDRGNPQELSGKRSVVLSIFGM